MSYREQLTKNDAIFYMDMVGSAQSPNYVSKLNKQKPYYELLKNRNSNEYSRFISIFVVMSYVLTERELLVLNNLYGLGNDNTKLKTVGQLINVSPERVRQIGYKAERKIVRELLLHFKNDFKVTKRWISKE